MQQDQYAMYTSGPSAEEVVADGRPGKHARFRFTVHGLQFTKGAVMIRIGFGGPSCCTYNKDPPQNSIGNYLGPYNSKTDGLDSLDQARRIRLENSSIRNIPETT